MQPPQKDHLVTEGMTESAFLEWVVLLFAYIYMECMIGYDSGPLRSNSIAGIWNAIEVSLPKNRSQTLTYAFVL